jgi:hypothetical protein
VSKIYKIERLMNLALLIKRHPGIHAKDIANIFETSERAIYREETRDFIIENKTSRHFDNSII